MNSGDYKHLITIQKSTDEQAANWSVKDGWSDVAQTWAAVEPLSGKELAANLGLDTTYTHRVRFYPMPGIVSGMRIAFEDSLEGRTRYLRVLGVRPVEFRNRELQLMCEERSVEQ